MQQRAAADLAGAANTNHAADVVYIGLTQVVHNAVANGVDLALKFSNLLAA